MSSENESSEEQIGVGTYEGSRNEEGQRHGFGEALLPNSDLYKGGYDKNLRNGYGMYVFTDGSRYEGEYVEGVRSGQGLMFYPDGSFYMGGWKDNVRNGHGIYTYANQDRYEGQWADDVKHGIGIYYYAADNSKFVGRFFNNKRDGTGEIYTTEYRYVGNFVDDLPEGDGIFYLFNGFANTGIYVHLDKTNDNPADKAASQVAKWIPLSTTKLFLTLSQLLYPSAVEWIVLKLSRKTKLYYESGGFPGCLSNRDTELLLRMPHELPYEVYTDTATKSQSQEGESF